MANNQHHPKNGPSQVCVTRWRSNNNTNLRQPIFGCAGRYTKEGIVQNRGMLTKWNDDRGFGFIKHSESESIFVHISSVKMMPRRPKEGDYLFYDVVIDPSGKKNSCMCNN